MKMAGLVVALFCVMVLAQRLGGPSVEPCLADEPAPLPDHYIVPGELSFSVDRVICLAAVRGSMVSISALVANAGPGNITPVMSSFFCGTALLGMTPLITNFTDMPGWSDIGLAYFVWDTAITEPGNHTIRVEVNASGGDSNLTNNSAEAVFRVTSAPPTMGLTVEPGELQVDPTESMKGQGTFTGTVRMQGMDGSRAVVNLEASLDTGWLCMLSPHTIIITDDNPYTFSISVVVPEKTLANPPGILNVTARAKGPGYLVNATAMALVTPMPYYRVMIESDRAYQELAPGSNVMYTFSVTNKGNSVDSYDIEVANLRDLANNRWMITLSTSELRNIAPGESRIVRLVAQSPMETTLWKEGASMIIIKATSRGAQDRSLDVTQSFPMYAYERGSYPPEICFGTFGMAIVIVAALVIAVAWRWRSKRKNASAGNAAGPENQTTGETATGPADKTPKK
jgi:hypothetical protein